DQDGAGVPQAVGRRLPAHRAPVVGRRLRDVRAGSRDGLGDAHADDDVARLRERADLGAERRPRPRRAAHPEGRRAHAERPAAAAEQLRARGGQRLRRRDRPRRRHAPRDARGRAAAGPRGDAPRARDADARAHREGREMSENNGPRLFGTDGVRGTANVEPMTSETALRLGRALAHVSKRSHRRHKILIGKDTRLSGYMLETAMASGICSMGVDVLLVGPLPTPGIAFLTRTMRADAGVVISASHNPFPDNGIKFFSQAGFKLPDDVEAEIERLVLSDSIDTLRPTATEIGKAFRVDDAIGRYNVFVKNTFP